MNENISNARHQYFIRKEEELSSRVQELEERLGNVSFDEEGNVLEGIDNLSNYNSSARESADVFRTYIIQFDIDKLKQDSKQYSDTLAREKRELAEAKVFLSEYRKLFKTDEKVRDESKLDIKSALLSASDEDLVNESKKLEEIRLEGEKDANELKAWEEEVQRLTVSVKNSENNIRINRELVQILKEEHKSLATRLKTKANYIDLDRVKRELAELNYCKLNLANVKKMKQEYDVLVIKEQNMQKLAERYYGSEKTAVKPTVDPKKEEIQPPLPGVINLGPIPETEPKKEEVQPPLPGVINLGPIPVAEENKTMIVYPGSSPIEGTPGETVKPEEPIKSEGVNKEWKINGLRLDFLETKGYFPDSYEMELNANYNGDINTIRTNYGKENITKVPRERVVVRIRNSIKSFVDSIRSRNSKEFVRRPEADYIPVVEETPRTR